MKKSIYKWLLLTGVVLLCTGCGKMQNSMSRAVQEKIELVQSEMEEVLSEEEIQNLQINKNLYATLNVPTDVEKIEDTYFIVDCYNNQVIYSDNLNASLTDWNVMCDSMSEGHTIASDGKVYIIDDTENNRLLVYQKRGNIFIHTQTLSNIGDRPHYVIYDIKTNTFYVLSSMTGEIYLLQTRESANADREVYVKDIKTIDEIANTYCRSFSIIDGSIYFTASNGMIVEADFPQCKTRKTYQVPSEIAGLVQLYKIEDYYYATVSTNAEGNQDYATILRARSLEEFQNGNYEDLYDTIEPDRPSTGTPYNISSFDGHYYLVEHRHGHGLFQFDVRDNQIKDITIVQ